MKKNLFILGVVFSLFWCGCDIHDEVKYWCVKNESSYDNLKITCEKVTVSVNKGFSVILPFAGDIDYSENTKKVTVKNVKKTASEITYDDEKESPVVIVKQDGTIKEGMCNGEFCKILTLKDNNDTFEYKFKNTTDNTILVYYNYLSNECRVEVMPSGDKNFTGEDKFLYKEPSFTYKVLDAEMAEKSLEDANILEKIEKVDGVKVVTFSKKEV